MRARKHWVIFDLARLRHLWADLSHFLRARTTFGALSIGIVALLIRSSR